MAELVAKLQELKTLPSGLHWFCNSWTHDDGSTSNGPPIILQDALGHDAEFRRSQIAECLLLYSYDDAQDYQNQLGSAIDMHLGRCDLCIEEYYKSKQKQLEKLRHDYDEDEVRALEQAFNHGDFQRISRGLDSATRTLQKLESAQRHKNSLKTHVQLALFEALCNDAFLADEEALDSRFQEPFMLVQSNKRLNIARFAPAVTAFLFDPNNERRVWAVRTWAKYREPPSKQDFEFAIRLPFSRIMQSVSGSVSDGRVLERTWYGIGLIIGNLNNELVTHSLRAMDIDVFTLALDHLKYETPSFRYLVEAIQKLLELAPKDFWDAMGSISPTTFVEQIFNNQQFDKFLLQSTSKDVEEASALKDMLSWIRPFLGSLDSAHQVDVSRSLAFQLLKRLQADHFPNHARSECYRTGLAMLASSLGVLLKGKDAMTSTGRIVVREALEVVGEHISEITNVSTLPSQNWKRLSCLEASLRIVKFALALECKCVKYDQESLGQVKASDDVQSGYGSYAAAIWDSVVKSMDYGNIDLAKAALVGINDLTGLEKLRTYPEEPCGKEKSAYNIKLGRLTHLVCQILERINDFSPRDLDILYRTPESATALISSLLSADANLHQASVNLIKSVSYESARREAVGHLLKTSFEPVLNAISWAINRVVLGRSYTCCLRLLKVASDVLGVLGDSQNGLLRTQNLSIPSEISATEGFWQSLWDALRTIYQTTEQWGRARVDDSDALKEFCRDTMELSESLFDQYSIFANAMKSPARVKPEMSQDSDGISSTSVALLKPAARTLQTMVKWLRLRDLFLVGIAVKLTKKILDRLSELRMIVEESASKSLEQIILGGSQARTHLTLQEKADLARALETNLGRSVVQVEVDSGTLSDNNANTSLAPKKSSRTKSAALDLEAWRARAKPPAVRLADHDIGISDGEYGDQEGLDRELLSVSQSVEMMQQMKEQQSQLPSAKHRLPVQHRQTSEFAAQAKGSGKRSTAVQSDAERLLFREKREREKEAKKKRDAENIAMVKKRAGATGQTLSEGSGLNGLGVKGKDHRPQGPSMMFSSGSESASDDDLDPELFGGEINAVKNANRRHAGQIVKASPKGPVKKVRQQRSAKDMRSRLTPDLTALHNEILHWDFFHDDDLPPGRCQDQYKMVAQEFRTPQAYSETFAPLLLLEAWQSFLQSKEEGSFKTFESTVANRMNVDAFLEISTTISTNEAKDIAISEADIVLMSKGKSPTRDRTQPHCFARVWKVSRKKAAVEVTYRASVSNNLVGSIVPSTSLYCAKILSITPLEREFGALHGLQYFDLCDEILKGKPSPLLPYSEKHLMPLKEIYTINSAQAKAVKSAVDNDAFTLIQGPPGSGKTKTIVAIVGSLLTGQFGDQGQPITRPYRAPHEARKVAAPAKKLLICAPSNAAVDELVMRFKQGVKTTDGRHQKIAVVRLGRSDAINANVKDVTLEELVNAKLNVASKKGNGERDEIGALIEAHKTACDELNRLRDTVDQSKAAGKPVDPEQTRDMEVLRRKKQQVSNQIDQARDKGNTAARDAEISRRQVQQEIINGAHVICATLSGSGHEMFQGLNVEFDTVVIDEAAQSIELSALIPLKYGCSKCILVGDPKQLPPTVLSREAARFQFEQSLFVRMQANHPTCVHLLDTQYRMHPAISAFPSKAFYDDRLVDGPTMAALRTRPWHLSSILGPYRFFDVKGFHQNAPKGHSLINIAEIDIALNLYNRLTKDCEEYEFRGNVAIITPYKSQLRELKSRFSRRYGETVLSSVEFNTTDAFQGRESEVVIFSCVRASGSRGIGFLSDIRRMNVGITRAKASLWVLGNSQSLMQGEFWSRLINDAKQRHCYSDGDLITLLQKPLLAKKPPDRKLSGSAGITHKDTAMLDAQSCPVTSMPNTTIPAKHIHAHKSDMVSDGGPAFATPSGGVNGLNNNLTCGACGSFGHITHQCDNLDAVRTAQGCCHRCGHVGHMKRDCTAERCITCGKIGHTRESCTGTATLSRRDQSRIDKLEIKHNAIRAMQPEKQRRKQLGDHDVKVPVVIPTKDTSSPIESNKRKRDLSPPPGARRPSKHRNESASDDLSAPTTTDRCSQDPRGKATTHDLKSTIGSANGAAQAYAKAQAATKAFTATQPPQKSASLPSSSSADNRSDEIIRVGENDASKRPPPRPDMTKQGMVRPPKKKREVDLFIRPKQKR